MADVATTAAREPAEERRVVMYTRNGCHLCDDAWKILQELRHRHGFQLKAVDVDGDTELVRQYGEHVPVVVVDGKERLWGRINRVLLERMLRST